MRHDQHRDQDILAQPMHPTGERTLAGLDWLKSILGGEGEELRGALAGCEGHICPDRRDILEIGSGGDVQVELPQRNSSCRLSRRAQPSPGPLGGKGRMCSFHRCRMRIRAPASTTVPSCSPIRSRLMPNCMWKMQSRDPVNSVMLWRTRSLLSIGSTSPFSMRPPGRLVRRDAGAIANVSSSLAWMFNVSAGRHPNLDYPHTGRPAPMVFSLDHCRGA